MMRNTSADLEPLVSRTNAGSKVRDALRLYIGRGRRYSVKQVSNATGVDDRLIECAMCRTDNADWRPLRVEHLLSIAGFLGPEFTTEWLSLAHQGAFLLPEIDDTPPGALAADNSDDNAVITRAAMDGVFDAEERRALRPIGVRMMARGAGLASLAA
ncbi:MAG TPA: hypothetical protein VF695_17185 [Sphingomonas sp.]|jgi:hypothetical protein